jgi:RNA polymerase sigma-B factor
LTEDEFKLWERLGQQDRAAKKELILFYLPLVDVQANRIARSTGADHEDLKQEGTIGLIKAITRFDSGRGVPFKVFARPYICGAIFDSSELTRNVARRQEEIYREIRRIENDLTKTLQRNPTIEEVAKEAELTVEQMRNAIDAKSVAFAGEFPDTEDLPASCIIETPRLEITIFLLEALSHLNSRENEIIRLYYWEDQSHEEIAQKLGLTVSNVTKLRQRALGKLRKLLRYDKGGRE